MQIQLFSVPVTFYLPHYIWALLINRWIDDGGMQVCFNLSSPPSGEHLSVDQSGGHHHLHGQEKIHHAGHQPCGEGLRANEVFTTRGRHLPSL